jgi:DNA-binding response OmpR family regulator
MLPDLEGTKLCELIRKKIFCPIIFIGCINEKYMLKAFIAGGDDYIRKPFSADELVARVKANLRRVKYDVLVNNSSGEKLKFNDLTIDLKKNIVINHNKEVHLTPLEFDILLFMVSNPNTILSYSDIYNNVWKAENNIDNRTVMVHVSNLRKKLKNCNNEKYIKTIKKRGYKFCC